jgi:hypothetical protein
MKCIIQFAIPNKSKSLSLEKTPSFTGINWNKGQYLLFEDGTVLNIIRSSKVVTIAV